MIQTFIILIFYWFFIHFKEMYPRITCKDSNYSIQNDKKHDIIERIYVCV